MIRLATIMMALATGAGPAPEPPLPWPWPFKQTEKKPGEAWKSRVVHFDGENAEAPWSWSLAPTHTGSATVFAGQLILVDDRTIRVAIAGQKNPVTIKKTDLMGADRVYVRLAEMRLAKKLLEAGDPRFTDSTIVPEETIVKEERQRNEFVWQKEWGNVVAIKGPFAAEQDWEFRGVANPNRRGKLVSVNPLAVTLLVGGSTIRLPAQSLSAADQLYVLEAIRHAVAGR